MNYTDPRLYLPSDHGTLTLGAELSLLPQQAHYLGNVMRRKPGQTIRVFNGMDGEWSAELVSIKRGDALISLTGLVRAQEETRPLHLVFSLLKREATELVIRMGTELGVTAFHPVVSARTNHHRINEERLLLIAREASEQCERLDIPAIHDVQPLYNCLLGWSKDKPLMAALERQEGKTSQALMASGLVTGPEGGFTTEEMQFLSEHEAVKAFSLGKRILRAETAICAGLALLDFR